MKAYWALGAADSIELALRVAKKGERGAPARLATKLAKRGAPAKARDEACDTARQAPPAVRRRYGV